MRINRKTLATGAGAAGLLGIGLYVAVPALAAPSPSPSATSSSAAPKHPGKGPWRFGPRAMGVRGVHGEATVKKKDGGFRLVTWQRGQITGISGSNLTVRSADGASWTWTTNGNTKVREEGEKSTLSALANGDQIAVFGERSGNTRTAELVREPRKR